MNATDRTGYGPLDVKRVKTAMERHRGPERAATWKEIAIEMGLRDDRKLRQIASACSAAKMRVPPHCANSRGRGRTLLGVPFMAKSILPSSITCADCGKTEPRRGGGQKWCADCSVKHGRARSHRYFEKHLAPPAPRLSGLAVVEQWRPVPGYGAGYAVSDQGRILAYQRFKPRLLEARIDPKHGYAYVLLHKPDAKPLSTTVHSVVALAFLGERQPGQQVNHKDGVKTHNGAANLEYVTAAENLWHARTTGLAMPGRLEVRRGERHPQAKLTAAQVDEIRAIGSGNATAIGRRYGVSRTMVRNIWLGLNWKAGS